FVNTLAIRTAPRADRSFREYLQEVKEVVLQAHENQEYPFEELVNQLNIERETSKHPLFDTMFAVQNISAEDKSVRDLIITPLENPVTVAKHEITVDVYEENGKIQVYFEFGTNLFKKSTIVRMSKHFINVLKSVVPKAERFISSIDILAEDDQELIESLNLTSVPVEHSNIISVFNRIVNQYPSRIAVVSDEESYTYEELDDHSTSVANFLREKGVQIGEIIPLLLKPSVKAIVAMLGVLKVGAAYLPVDLKLPKARIQFMLGDCEAKVVITDNLLIRDLTVTGERSLINLDEIDKISLQSDLNTNITPESLAYVIYTSGSTGFPKGVMIEHKSVTNLCDWFNEKYKIFQPKSVLQMTNLAFDVSVEEIFGTLLNGATLCIPNHERTIDPEYLHSFIEKHDVKIAQFVPAVLKPLIADQKRIASLEIVICGGEKIGDPLAKEIMEKGYRLFNHYGPTETTVDALAGECKIGEEISLGVPIRNTKVYVMNASKQLQPIGVPGELYVEGVGIARGYLNREDNQKESFIDHPLIEGGLLYKTGDLVSLTESGKIKYIGRIDDQIKIRGHRVEISEVTKAIMKYPAVDDALVIINDKSNNSELISYLVGGDEINRLELGKALSDILPKYMIPSYFVMLESFPLTPNGKVDRKQLPKPDLN
ncbi:non-ribosomal peptide synthetase, partial [Peribacillus simplex]|uniref:non-ribosomal peptide synthetase n=1 Tax=Peribacillus simplex TaxID=1478 RepID=UPI003D27653E